jgi:hypothetical protein
MTIKGLSRFDSFDHLGLLVYPNVQIIIDEAETIEDTRQATHCTFNLCNFLFPGLTTENRREGFDSKDGHPGPGQALVPSVPGIDSSHDQWSHQQNERRPPTSKDSSNLSKAKCETREAFSLQKYIARKRPDGYSGLGVFV